MVPIAEAMIQYMHTHQGLVGEGTSCASGYEQVKQYLKYRKVELATLFPASKISCSALDAALSLLKYTHMGEGIVNILPRRQVAGEFGFKSQQRKVRQILMDHLGVRVLPFFNIFTEEETNTHHSSGSHHGLRKQR